MDPIKRERFPGFQLDSHLRLLEEIQVSARTFRSARIFAGLVKDVRRSIQHMSGRKGARRVIQVQVSPRRVLLKRRARIR